MPETKRIARQFQAAYAGGAWHGPAVKQVLKGVTAAQAAARPVKGAHSIWEIVLHISGWQKVAAGRVRGERVRQPEEGDWPEVGLIGEPNWKKSLKDLDRSYTALRKIIFSLKDSDLSKNVLGRDNYVYILLHGIIQHNLYHAGQIMLLKRALRAKSQRRK